MLPDVWRVSSFSWIAESTNSAFVGSRVYKCLAVTCHLHALAEMPGSFTCYCGNTGVGVGEKISI